MLIINVISSEAQQKTLAKGLKLHCCLQFLWKLFFLNLRKSILNRLMARRVNNSLPFVNDTQGLVAFVDLDLALSLLQLHNED